ncbi:hypothetical protein [Streptomyces sp. NPDC021212]|uniref:hypothetical protein n=1 Tax=Streptomyces sp. NPDC021212 TaxID=3365118 RepID=UPI00379823DA
MSVRVTTAEGCPGVHDLYRWLTEDPDVAGAAEVALVDEDDDAEALVSLEVIPIVVSNLWVPTTVSPMRPACIRE